MIGVVKRMSIRMARAGSLAAALAGLTLAPVAAQAQVRTVDPNMAIDSDLAPVPQQGSAPTDPGVDTSAPPPAADPYAPPASSGTTATGAPVTAASPPAAATPGDSYQQDDLIGAAEGVFGKGAEGLAGMIEKILKDQGRPNAYIAGREASGAFVVGLRYGSGTLNHKVEGMRQVYWTGPSIGFDVGGDGSKVMMLVYNLPDINAIYGRYPGVSGSAYAVGGLGMTVLKKDNVVVVPIRSGLGARLGINAGYLKFTSNATWNPF